MKVIYKPSETVRSMADMFVAAISIEANDQLHDVDGNMADIKTRHAVQMVFEAAMQRYADDFTQHDASLALTAMISAWFKAGSTNQNAILAAELQGLIDHHTARRAA